MATQIRTITDPMEYLVACLKEVERGNQQTRDEIKQLQKDLKGGLEEAGRLRAEIVKLRVRSKRIGDD